MNQSMMVMALMAAIVVIAVIVASQSSKKQKEAAEKAMVEGKKFLEENSKKEGVITTASGLQYEILVETEGPKPSLSSKVKTHYHGTLIDGSVFDSSVKRGAPISFPLTNVIRGWQEGIQLMSVGAKYRFYIPAELGYGNRGAGTIPPNSVLIFEVELLGF